MMDINYKKGLILSKKDLMRLRFYKARVDCFCKVCSKRSYDYSTSKDNTNRNIKKGSYCFGVTNYGSEYSGRCCLNCFKKFANKFKNDLKELKKIINYAEKEYKDNKKAWIKNNIIEAL